MIRNEKTLNKFQCSGVIFEFIHQVQNNTYQNKILKNQNQKFFDEKSIQKCNDYSRYHKLSLSKTKRISKTNNKDQIKQKPSYFTIIQSTTQSNQITNNKNITYQNKVKPKKVVQIAKINNLLNEFKSKYDALSKKINVKNNLKISYDYIGTELNYPFSVSKTPQKSILKKQNRFSYESKTYCKVINQPNIRNSKSVQNQEKSILYYRNQIPETSQSLRRLNSKAILNQLSECQQNNLKVSIEMIIQKDKDLNVQKFPLSQTVLSYNDILSHVEQNESIQESIIIDTFQQFPLLIPQIFQSKQNRLKHKLNKVCEQKHSQEFNKRIYLKDI